ncbi:putative receptor-like protein kinase [Iris pallida]|uniref:Receptor-like protein kinase n=1 Tax=Iris pallida TaxID=29817 RepID=A0AAX6F9H7_IRIPA|nr:putative receptor-like protein kinase [Iris pallida]
MKAPPGIDNSIQTSTQVMVLLLQLLLLLRLSAAPTAAGDAQTNLLNLGCSQYNATKPALFPAVLNATFSDLYSQLNSSSSPLFATSDRPSGPVYSLFLCRDYLSPPDCLLCLSSAVSSLRKCGLANGARAVLDGCFLRYETAPFSDQTTLPGNTAVCGNRTSASAAAAAAAEGLMSDLAEAVPRIGGYFAAAERGGGAAVYGVAQCARTVSESGCAGCLAVALGNVKGCPPAAEGRAVDAGCFMRYSDADFFGGYKTVDLSTFLDSGGSSHKGAIIGGAVGGFGGLLLLCLLVFLWIRSSRKSEKARRGDILGATELQGPVNFHYKDLKSATKNFSEENKLGEGGFGDVYKGVLETGKVVAVKKMAIAQTSRAKADFQSEVKLISNVHHRNLVRLLGCSSKGPDLLLVYEYMANRSLDRFLYGEQRGTLNWKQRFDIIVGMARGLAYLHHEFHVCVIHRDIKSSNILLDDDFQPKVADFGLARLMPSDQSHLSTKFAGTLGYTAPEYAIHGQLSEKVDTYSYGVVVLEIITGRKTNDMRLEPETQYLLEWAWRLYENGDSMKLIDESLNLEECNPEELKRVIQIALLCTQSTVAARPTMSEVVVSLLTRAEPVMHPTRPTFIDATSRVHASSSTSTGSSSMSNATVSITQFSAR